MLALSNGFVFCFSLGTFIDTGGCNLFVLIVDDTIAVDSSVKFDCLLLLSCRMEEGERRRINRRNKCFSEMIYRLLGHSSEKKVRVIECKSD